jgi:hypothetical protein
MRARFYSLLAILLLTFLTGPAMAGGLDNTIARVHGDLEALLHCEWQGSTPYTICPARQVRDVVGVYADASDNFPDTIEFHPVLTLFPPDSDANKLSHDTIVAIVHYFFPDWKEEVAWVSDALKAADDDDDAEHVIKRGGATLYIRSLDVEDGEGSYALVVITKKPSIDQWTIDKTSIVK